MKINDVRVELKNMVTDKENEGTIFIKIITNYL